MRSKKLLIIAPYQFGELSDCYYWAKYATRYGVKTTYIGYKYKSRRIKERTLPEVRTIRVPHLNNRLLHGFVFYLVCFFEIILHNHFNIIVCRMPHCEWLAKWFPARNVILDVRTLSISPDEEVRKRQNQRLIDIKQSFKTCTALSEGVGEALGKPYRLLPLGAEPLSETGKIFDTLKLFYIGTFNGRNLSTFIKGLALFQKRSDLNCTFDIVGGGTQEEERSVRETIVDCGVKGVKLYGYLNHDEAVCFFDRCNVGVCYVPITDYYQHQPPTKLYEYLLSGMACIATNTESNAEVINDGNGVLIGDDEESVVLGLQTLADRLTLYDSVGIVQSSRSYQWDSIVKEYLLPLLQ